MESLFLLVDPGERGRGGGREEAVEMELESKVFWLMNVSKSRREEEEEEIAGGQESCSTRGR